MNDPIGVILAGGGGRRIGGSKATVSLCGMPLISYPLDALREALSEVAVLAKPDSELPPMPGVTVWIEPTQAQHPLIGIRHALALAHGRAVLVCGVDMPLLTVDLVRTLAGADPQGRPAVVAARGGELEPLLGCYQPAAAPLLGFEAAAGGKPLREVVAKIRPRLVEVKNPQLLFNVNSPDDLLHAAAILDSAGRGRSGPSRRSRSSSEPAE